MGAVDPYTLLALVGSCDIGDVWSAADGSGEHFSVAILHAEVARDQQWREAFAATAHALSQASVDRLPIAHADYTSPTPWVACVAERGAGAAHIFLALGRTYVPAPLTADEPVAAPATPMTDPPEPEAATPTATEPQPQPDGSPPARSVSAPPVEAGLSWDEPPVEAGPSWPQRPGEAAPRQVEPAGTVAPAPPPRRAASRFRLALVALSALIVGTAAGALLTGTGSTGQPPGPVASSSGAPDLGLASAPASAPGAEPPQGGGWPAKWPKFGGADRRRAMSDLAGVGFSFEVPEGWECTERTRGSGHVAYTCGMPAGGALEIGGDLIVRQCAKPCNEERRTSLRTAEEAWGLRWIRSGPFATWAETTEIDARPRYGLVYVSYWRSVPEDALDRQLVLRMTAPVDRADEVRKVANSVRDETFTL